jgi:hypothetical protein
LAQDAAAAIVKSVKALPMIAVTNVIDWRCWVWDGRRSVNVCMEQQGEPN